MMVVVGPFDETPTGVEIRSLHLAMLAVLPLSSSRFMRIPGNIFNRQEADGWNHVETFFQAVDRFSKKCQDTAAAPIDIALITIKQRGPGPSNGSLSRASSSLVTSQRNRWNK